MLMYVYVCMIMFVGLSNANECFYVFVCMYVC